MQNGSQIFHPVLSVLFCFLLSAGSTSLAIRRMRAEAAFITWHCIHEPKFLTDEGRKLYIDAIEVDQLDDLQTLSKEEFLQACDVAFNLAGQMSE